MQKIKNYLDWALALQAQNPHMAEAVFPNTQLHQPDYDYRMAYNADQSGKLAANGHLSDIGKLPNHPTFSNESAYAFNNPTAGQWRKPLSDNGEWLYNNPSRGLLYAHEESAYQPPTEGMMAVSKIWNALNQRKPGLINLSERK